MHVDGHLKVWHKASGHTFIIYGVVPVKHYAENVGAEFLIWRDGQWELVFCDEFEPLVDDLPYAEREALLKKRAEGA